MNLDACRLVLCASDQLLHVCVHGRRSSPIPSEHWMADAITIVRRAGDSMAWDTLAAEARERRLTYQLRRALGALAAEHGDVPRAVMAALHASRPAWWERLEHRAKQRPQTIGTVVTQFWCRHRRGRTAGSTAGQSSSFVTEMQAMAGCERFWQRAPRAARRRLRPLRGTTRAFDAYGRRIEIDVDAAASVDRLVDLLDERLPTFPRPGPPGPPDRAYRIVLMPWTRAPEPRYRVMVDGQARGYRHAGGSG